MSTFTKQSPELAKIRGNSTRFDSKTLVAMAMLTAIAYVLTFLSNFIPLKVAGFLEFDFKDVAIVVGGFLYGPGASAMMVVVVSLIQFITISSTGLIGLGMNLLATGSFCCVASLIYWYRPNFKGAILGLSLGGVVMTIMMLLWNYAITPMYMGIPREEVAAMLVPIFLPFNLVKSGLNMGVILAVYPSVMKALTRANLVQNPEEGRETSVGKATAVAVGVFALFAVLALVITGTI